MDTGHNYPEVIDFRDRLVERLGLRLEVAHVQDWIDDGRLVERADGTRNPLQTMPLLDTINSHRFDAVLAAGGGTRNGPGPRSGSSACATRSAAGTRARSGPSCGTSTTAGTLPASTCGSSPSPTGPSWTWRYIRRERIELPSIYYSHRREVFRRDGMWLAEGPWGGPRGNEALQPLTVRYRTVGDGSSPEWSSRGRCTVDEIIAEVMASWLTERAATGRTTGCPRPPGRPEA